MFWTFISFGFRLQFIFNSSLSFLWSGRSVGFYLFPCGPSHGSQQGISLRWCRTAHSFGHMSDFHTRVPCEPNLRDLRTSRRKSQVRPLGSQLLRRLYRQRIAPRTCHRGFHNNSYMTYPYPLTICLLLSLRHLSASCVSPSGHCNENSACYR